MADKSIHPIWNAGFYLNEFTQNCKISSLYPFSPIRSKLRVAGCRSKGFISCAECPDVSCVNLEKAQSVWDEVPNLADKLTSTDFTVYAQPYCDHRKRLAAERAEFFKQR